MKILFAVEDIYVVEPLGIMQMIALAKRSGHECSFATYGQQDMVSILRKETPDVVALSIMSVSDGSCKRVIKQTKGFDRNIFVVVGGPHPTYSREFIKDSEADAVCVGEGDEAFKELLGALHDKVSIESIPNIHTKSARNAPRNLIEDLDSLPFADRDLVYKNSRLGKSKLKSFMATRGCPYSCTYCFNSGYKELYRGKGRILRRRSIDHLLEEIKRIKSDYPMEMIRFGDDVFLEGMSPWSEEFLERYPKEIGLPYYCLLSPAVINPELAKRLRKSGCISVGMSIESGNEKIRYEVLKRRISDDKIVGACRALVDAGIKTFTNIMVGLPGATLSDEVKSVELARKCRTTFASFTIFSPFPGTELYDRCVEMNLIPKTEKPVFPRSTTDRSVLSSFSDTEKNIQKNIMLLGNLANANGFFKWIVLKWLIYWPPNKPFFYISFLVRNYYNFRIWPISVNFKEFFEYVSLVFKHDKKYIE